MDGFFSPPSVITGLLGEQEAERLRKQSIGTGLVGALIGGLSAAPNYRYGGIAPILGQALKSGFEGMQGTYTSALENYQTQQKLVEAQRQQQERQMAQEALSGLSEEDQRLYRLLGQSGYGQILANRSKPIKAARQLSTAEAEAAGLRVGEGQMYQLTADNEVKLIPGTEPVKAERPTLQDRDAYASELFGGSRYNELSPREQAVINKRIQDERVATASASAPKPPSQQPGFKDAASLRNEWRTSADFKAFQEMRGAFQTIEAAASTKSPVSDVALATKMMKLLDPGSVVRESELAIAMNSAAPLDRILNYANRIKTGEKLTPTQREEFRVLSKNIYKAAEQEFKNKQAYYGEIAKTGGLDPYLVIGEGKKIIKVDY
jgi:hypothetical protein